MWVVCTNQYVTHVNKCSDKEMEYAICSDGDVRLTGGGSNWGRLEVCINHAWGTVCNNNNRFSRDEALVACRQLGKLQVEGRGGY